MTKTTATLTQCAHCGRTIQPNQPIWRNTKGHPCCSQQCAKAASSG